MALFGNKKKENPPPYTDGWALVLNYVRIDSIDGKTMDELYWIYSDIKKGILAPNVEIVYLAPGVHTIAAHGVTYQTETASIVVEVEAGKLYILGAGVDDDDKEGLFFKEPEYDDDDDDEDYDDYDDDDDDDDD